jgi:hypothetical protein
VPANQTRNIRVAYSALVSGVGNLSLIAVRARSSSPHLRGVLAYDDAIISS